MAIQASSTQRSAHPPTRSTVSETDIMDESDKLPQNPPMPETTKKAGKRRKHPFGPKQPGMRQPNPIGMIYAIGTLAQIADKATESRLSTTGPPTSTRLAGYNFIWGETDKQAHPCP
jgi:hypothetical protein